MRNALELMFAISPMVVLIALDEIVDFIVYVHRHVICGLQDEES